MKISSEDFRVRKGAKVKLKPWPTFVKPVYKSKKQNLELLREHVANAAHNRNFYTHLTVTLSYSCFKSWMPQEKMAPSDT